jgi:hypothetical protein
MSDDEDEEEGGDEAEGFLNGLEEEMRARDGDGGEGDEVESSGGEGKKRKRAEDFSESDLGLEKLGHILTRQLYRLKRHTAYRIDSLLYHTQVYHQHPQRPIE